MTETPAEKAASAAQTVTAPLATPAFNPPLVDPLIEDEDGAPLPFAIGDVVEFTDSIRFQMGAQKNYQKGEVIGLIVGTDMCIVAVDMRDSMAYDAPRVEYVFANRQSVMRKVPSGE